MTGPPTPAYIARMQLISPTTCEHPIDVLTTLKTWSETSDCALVVVHSTEGGAVRSIGALMAVHEDGASAGYVSGGCIDADVVGQALAALEDKKPRKVRYGAGSPYVDLPLPCGGSITVLIIPTPDKESIATVLRTLNARNSICVRYHESGLIEADRAALPSTTTNISVTYEPKIRIRIAGRGADCLALARLAIASNYDLHVQLTNAQDIEDATQAGVRSIEHLQTPTALPATSDDPWTAFVLMFHDSHWEAPLLRQALEGPAFYIGAVGSRRTHAKRCIELSQQGISEAAIARIHGPIGLVPSLRDASMVAVSALAEIIDVFRNRLDDAARKTAIILLAAGASSRFEDGDKLTAKLEGHNVLSLAARAAAALPFKHKIAVTPHHESKRAKIAKEQGWRVVENPDAAKGQSSSIRVGLDAIEADQEVEQFLFLLGDMPFVPAHHISALLLAKTPEIDAVMTTVQNFLTPPTLFSRNQLAFLKELTGDKGAKMIFNALENTVTIPLANQYAADIDTMKDLMSAENVLNG